VRIFAWGGGALFVLSLAYCLWWYLVPLGRDLPWAGFAAVAWNAGLVAVFASHHSVFAREPVKRAIGRLVGGGVRSVYVWVASGLLIAVCILWKPVGGACYDARGVLRAAAAGVQLLGIALIAWSVARIDPLELAGIHPSATSGLQITGPYRLVRHPLYLGWMLAAFATPHLTGDRLTFALLTSLYLVMAVPWEERSLNAAFGNAYARYADQVRWRVIPFIY
jgi:protein-S-isoprenylcysteine O-methyltransferase Ste14